MEVTCYLVVSRCIVSGILNVTEVCRSSLLIEAQRFFVSFEMAPSGRDGLNGSLCKWSWEADLETWPWRKCIVLWGICVETILSRYDLTGCLAGRR